MQLFVRTLDGSFECINVSEGATLEEVSALFGASLNGVVADNAVLDINIASEGGKKKKRKKKTFVSKKRVPHQRKKEKLKVLKLFTINKDGSVEYNHEVCENCKGSFLANHKDGRKYCGKCHFTKDKNNKVISKSD